MNKKILTLLIGEGTSNFGNYLFILSTNWYIYKMTNSSFIVGIVSAITSFLMILNIFTGIYADNHKKTNIMKTVDILQIMLMLFTISILNKTSNKLIIIVITVLIEVAIGTFFTPAEDALIPQLVKKEKLNKVNGINQSIIAISQIFGFIFGGLITPYINISTFLIINSVTFLVSIICLLILSKIYNEKIYKSIKNKNKYTVGIKFLIKNKILKKSIIIILISNFALGPLTSLDVVWNNQILHATSYIYGLSQSLLLIGIIIGSISSSYINLSLKTILGYSILFIGLISILMSSIETIFITLTSYLLIGINLGIINTSGSSIFQIIPPKSIIGSINGILRSASTIIMPLGIIIGSLITQTININFSFIISGLIMIIVGLFTLIKNNESLDIKFSQLTKKGN